MIAPEHTSWCTAHVIEEDTDGSAVDVCRGEVTRGDFTVTVEDSPSWPPSERNQVVPPELPDGTWINAHHAHDLADALTAAADLVDSDDEERG